MKKSNLKWDFSWFWFLRGAPGGTLFAITRMLEACFHTLILYFECSGVKPFLLLLFVDIHFWIVDDVFVAVNSDFILRLRFDRGRGSEKYLTNNLQDKCFKKLNKFTNTVNENYFHFVNGVAFKKYSKSRLM